MTRMLFDGVVETSYGQFDLVWGGGTGFDGDFDRFFGGQVNGLVGAANPDGIYVNLARYGGGSQVRIELCDAEPSLEDGWPDVVEVSSSVPPEASPHWESWAGETREPLGQIPPGDYRVRVSARGRDEGHAGEFNENVVDFYLIQMWPAPTGPDAIVRVGSENARYWHGEVGNRR